MSLLTPRQVAEDCGLAYRTVLDAIHEGELPAYKLRGRLRIKPEAKEAWLESQAVKPAPKPMLRVRGRQLVVDKLPL